MNAKLPAKQLFHALSLILITILLLSSTGQSVEARPLHLEFDCSQQAEIPKEECDDLVTLYNSTDGANWTDNTGWLQTNTPCSWYGVGCDNGYVVSISLYENNLMGSIPPELGNLASLYHLNLSGNKLSDSIPPQLGDLALLTELYLESNELSGDIPSELGNLSNLEILAMGWGNSYTGSIPPELGQLTNLRRLDIAASNLNSAIPKELGNLTNLEILGLSYNNLHGAIPSELGQLSNLREMGLNWNSLTGTIPPELGNLTNAIGIDLGGNQLTGPIPPDLGNLTNLSYLGLFGNQLSGVIPSELGQLANLQYLYLFDNQLSGAIPVDIGNLTNLEYLYLHNNLLSGEIPSSITNLENLYEFHFDACTGLTASDPSLISFLDERFPGWSDCYTDLRVTGQYYWILNGSTNTRAYNYTSFGNRLLNWSRMYEYKIDNIGDMPINLTGNPKVEITGSPAFSIYYQPEQEGMPIESIPPDKSAEFGIWFRPTTVGVHTATVTIANNSADKNPYTFTIQGVGVWDDPYEKDNDFSTAKTIVTGTAQTRALYPGSRDKDYVTFTLTRPSGITLETTGEWGYDTEIALYDENYNLIGYDNDGGEFLYSKLTRTCNANPLPAGTYYAMVYNYEGVVPQYQLHFDTEDCPIQILSTTAQDGWVLESGETTNKGGSLNTKSTTINIGDDALNRQYRAILSFNTALPAGAVVTKATLKFKYAGKTGTLPFSTHGKLLVDVKTGAFGNNPALAKGDFNAGANKNGLFSLGKSTGWFSKVFSASQLTYINTSGVTQFRLRFAKDDNNDLGADFLKIYSGNAGSNAPQLIIEYHVP